MLRFANRMTYFLFAKADWLTQPSASSGPRFRPELAVEGEAVEPSKSVRHRTDESKDLAAVGTEVSEDFRSEQEIEEDPEDGEEDGTEQE